MTRSYARLAALALAAVTLTTTPAFAQRNRRDGGNRDGGNRAERAEPRDRGQSRENGQPREQAAPRQRFEQRAPEQQVERRAPEQRAPEQRVPQQRFERRAPEQRFEYRDRAEIRPRGNRPTYVVPYRPYSYGYRSYARPYVYSVPYGYRPYGYRPGWSLNFYFGRPYSVYGYPAYGTLPSYGYYSVVPGRAYGAVRIVDAPRDAQVFVDGYYAGVVDDYDGVFQHLNLEAGPHHIEIQAEGYPPSEFDVRVEPGQTITYHAYRY